MNALAHTATQTNNMQINECISTQTNNILTNNMQTNNLQTDNMQTLFLCAHIKGWRNDIKSTKFVKLYPLYFVMVGGGGTIILRVLNYNLINNYHYHYHHHNFTFK